MPLDRPRHPVAEVLLLSSLSALPPLSIDMGLPALAELQAGLHTTAAMAGLTVSLFMVGFTASPLLYGMLSDRHGRKPLLLVGLSLFALGGIVCVFAGSIASLLAARLLQGAGAGVGPTIAMAASRDRFDGVMLRRRLANLAMLRNAAPILAPSIGAALLLLGGWRAIPVMLAVTGVMLVAIMATVFTETLPPTRRRGGSLVAELWRTARRLAGQPRALAFGAVQGLAGGALFSYVSGSPLLLIGVFRVSAVAYAGLFAITAWGIVVGAFLAGRLAHRVSARRVLAVGGTLMLAAPLLAALLISLRFGGLVAPMACFVTTTLGFGLTAPTASHAALEPVPEIAGTAAALMNTFQMLCMSIASVLVAFLFPLLGGVAIPGVMALFAGLGAVIQIALRR